MAQKNNRQTSGAAKHGQSEYKRNAGQAHGGRGKRKPYGAGARGGQSTRGGQRHYAHKRGAGKASAGASTYIEGRHACEEALAAGVPLKRALVASGDDGLAALIGKLDAAGVAVEEVERSWLDALSSHGAHQGIVCEAAPYRYASLADVIARAGTDDALVVVLDHVTDQGNLGAIVRSAEIVGAAGVVIAKARAAGVGVGAYKTSAGAVMHLPVAQVANLASAVEELKNAGFWVAAASEHAEQDVWHSPLEGRIALVMGSEGQGVSRLLLDRCDFTCRLPQRGQVESLNVAQAATVLCYEWLRRTQES